MDETERAFFDQCRREGMKKDAIDDALRAFRRWRSSGPPVFRKRTDYRMDGTQFWQP